jgi:hypothetical protein
MAKRTSESEMSNGENTLSNNGDLEPAAANAGESAQTAASSGLVQIAKSLTDEMPEVQQHAIDQESAAQQLIKDESAQLRDAEGMPFDAAIHKVGPDGKPTLSTKGKLVRRPGRKAGQGSAAVSSVVSRPQVGPTATETSIMQARQAGNFAAGALLQIGVLAGGEEWQPRLDKESGLDEQQMLQCAFGDYFVAKGITDIPPGIALTIAIGGYMMPRFFMPKTKTRMQRATIAIKKWWADRKLKKYGLKAVEDDKQTSSMAA